MRDDLTLNTTRLGQELEVKKLYRAVVFNFPLNFPLDITLWEVEWEAWGKRDTAGVALLSG